MLKITEKENDRQEKPVEIKIENQIRNVCFVFGPIWSRTYA